MTKWAAPPITTPAVALEFAQRPAAGLEADRLPQLWFVRRRSRLEGCRQLPSTRFTILWNPNQSAPEGMACPSEKSLFRSPNQNGMATNADQRLDGLSPSEFVSEPLAPVGQDWNAEAGTEPVEDEFRVTIAEDCPPRPRIPSRTRLREFIG